MGSERPEGYLRERGLLTDEQLNELEADIETELTDAVETAKSMADAADPADMFEHAYDEMPPWLRRQRHTFTEGGVSDGE